MRKLLPRPLDIFSPKIDHNQTICQNQKNDLATLDFRFVKEKLIRQIKSFLKRFSLEQFKI